MQTLQSTTVRGDVSVCIVPANVGYLFIYLYTCLCSSRERDGTQPWHVSLPNNELHVSLGQPVPDLGHEVRCRGNYSPAFVSHDTCNKL